MKIGELARRAGCTVETLRFYERRGLLNALRRSESNYRSYDESSVRRIQFIRHCRSLDIGLDEIMQLLASRDAPEEDCGNVNALIDRHIDQVAERIAQLTALRDELLTIRGRCNARSTSSDCAILRELSRPKPA
eukprot:gene30841-38122_t